MEIRSNDPSRSTGSSWAPWWAYVVPIVAFNWLRQILVSPGDTGDALNIAMFVGLTILVVAAVTLVYRATGAGAPDRR